MILELRLCCFTSVIISRTRTTVEIVSSVMDYMLSCSTLAFLVLVVHLISEVLEFSFPPFKDPQF
jgi:NADH:ubiquinone oxidoreductase subunit H